MTTLPEFRGKGYAAFLLSNIEKFAKLTNVDFIYLQGIENFYGNNNHHDQRANIIYEHPDGLRSMKK